MIWLLQAFVIFLAASFTHVCVMALVAHALGITVRQVSLGFGPTLVEHGRLRLGYLLLGGFVKLKDSRAEPVPESETGNAWNHQPIWKQISIPLSGCLALLMFGLAILGGEGWRAFLKGFSDATLGSLGPFSTAQEFLSNGERYFHAQSLLASAALLSMKFCAWNLLPLPSLNGGQILIVLAKRGSPHEYKWEDKLNQWLILPFLYLSLAWILALGWYTWRVAS